MNIVYSDRAKQVKSDFQLLEEITGKLKEVLAPARDEVAVRWSRVEDERDGSHYSLKISDATGEAEATFTPEELRKEPHMRVMLYKLWGQLLQARNRKLMEALKEPFDTERD